MNQEIIEKIRQTFESELSGDPTSKVASLEEAVKRHIRPGMAVMLGEFANGAAREMVRRFRGSKPEFTIINSARDYTSALVYSGLVKKLIGVAYMHLYPTAGPNRLIQQAFNEGRIEIEGWTSLTLLQRLMAGAMDLEAVVTRSLLESDIARDNQDCLHPFQGPFDKHQDLALIKSLNPDVAVVHGWAADPQGNVILGSPYYMGPSTWGARASREGTVVTVEKIVTTEFIRRHSCLVSIPGHMVRSVSEVPFGAHPQGLNSLGMGIEAFKGYRPDIEFIAAYREAVKDPAWLSKWMEEWVFQGTGHGDYRQKLGAERLARLSAGVGENEGKQNLNDLLQSISLSPEYTPNERTIIAAARKIEEIVLKKKYVTFLLGVGFSALAGWLAYYGLKKKGWPVKLLIGTGVYGYSPQPGNPAIGATANIETGLMLTDAFQSYGGLIGGLNNRCLSVLGAAQVDKYGNINSTKVGKEFIAGSGGANDATNAEEVMVISRQSPKRFVDRVDYITSPGTRVRTIVSDLGVFEKPEGEKEMVLTGIHFNDQKDSLEEKIRAVKQNCGWELKVSSDVKEMSPPEMEELAMIRCFDPEGLYR
jgi:acyl CoA:acetate/3-ketoacid CoA transferase alpha subunit/acyl CoA:acetate/3-ketoacid CoA transferase beta subunit